MNIKLEISIKNQIIIKSVNNKGIIENIIKLLIIINFKNIENNIIIIIKYINIL